MIDVNFDSLFTLELLHRFYADQLCSDFSITPSNNTLGVINGHKLVVKQYHNKLYAGIQSNSGKPFIPVDEGMQMTFYLWPNNPLFFNYTNLPAGYNAGKIFYFTNRNNNTANGKSLLSAQIAAYDNSTSYIPGDLATDGAGVVYRTISSNNPISQHPLSDPNFWQAVDNNSYASAYDVLQYLPLISTYNFTSQQSAANITVLGYSGASNDYSIPVFSKTINFTNPLFSFTLDLSSLAAGKYSLTVNGNQQWIYVNDELAGSKPFAVADIFNAAAPVSCNLVDVAGNLLSPTPVYSIYFLNRATVWKYVLPNGKTGTISDIASTYTFASLANDITSTTPIPLSDSLLNFKLTINSNDYTPIPCADPRRLTTLTQGADTYACSEIFINY